MKLAFYWLGLVVVVFGSQWIYQPSLTLTIVGSVLLILLSVVVGWSATKIGGGLSGVLKTLAVAVVAGVMNTQALDVAYASLSAPAGGRFEFVAEVASAAVLLAVAATLLRFLSSGPEEEKEPSSNQ
jgi:phosphotransferase system  glucose/maltose/N-acetylglucosamine-specific IIC component